jgi:type 1 fimbriae regulatory protein FimB/type 1 fimbriae regulatory protein FimE
METQDLDASVTFAPIKASSTVSYIPRRPRNREHLTPREIKRLLKAARANRYGLRDYTLILLAYTHGLRVCEALWARWQDFDFNIGVYHVNRLKGSLSGDHPIPGFEIRALRRFQREGPTCEEYLFCSERGGPMTGRGVHKMIERLAVRAGLGDLNIHPHMLRHSCGYYLVDKGVDLRTIQSYLGHKTLQQTIRYTFLSPKKFRRLWDD